MPTLADLRSLRAQAYVILAWGHLWTAGVRAIEPLESIAWSAALRLVDCYRRSQRPDWQWFESRITYANAVLPHALFVAARRWPADDFLDVAKASFAFLDRETTAEIGEQESGIVRQQPGVKSQKSEVLSSDSRLATTDSRSLTPVFWPVGNRDWYSHGEDKSPYDQQPVEALTMADAAFAAFTSSDDESYLAVFRRARDWFSGQNSLRQPLADVRCGACYDGLQPSGLNQNQGAESTLAYLWTELHHFEVQESFLDNRKAAVASA